MPNFFSWIAVIATRRGVWFVRAIAVLFAVWLGYAFAHAQTDTIDLPLDTGGMVRPTTPSAVRRAPRTRINNTRSLPPARGGLNSRGGYSSAPAPRPVPRNAAILGKLGVIVPTTVTLRVSQDARSRALSVIPRGTHVAVVTEGGDYIGILMIDHSVGWLPRQAVQMIDYQVAVSAPPPPAGPDNSNKGDGDINEQDVPDTDPAPRTPTRRVTYSDELQREASRLDPHVRAALKEAITYLGVPYVWAGNTRSGIDCSGFVKNVFATQGVSLPRHSGDQAQVGREVAGDDLRPGDRLYFAMGNHTVVSHTGIYIGGGYFIHASSNHHQVDVDPITKPNYANALVAIRRDFE